MTSIPEDHWTFMPMQQALSGPVSGFCRAVSGHWWSVHPEKGLRFYHPKGRKGTGRYGAPQCNSDRRIVERLKHPDDEMVYIERVWLPVNINDYVVK